ncbi:hypothetical protein J3Q64DRAFT_1731583 [Phycomyces blakesleeanus]|uniref:Uncharacterized protein n=2 Tax=Phycomyces blakesleeanus TaxID=4837 RepID=A0A162NHY5_PHYB8|nr:hypothetical protein PHYBLDRAFT_67645 [Phycomyces blakesleeanus NRRL 1555(-)]OAD74428.1 hypothetical protein PHYBLDRAFT_67645 [Phycomyces blakesleeanus NRRL 1555(-)]|eukprot:XP_018292468.1 hypothetical protein PHYBLDRAFT_67645 [Phycomyces blakesleeanus NRRL 1555(-)]
MVRLEEAPFNRDIPTQSNWLQPNNHSHDTDNADGSTKKKSMDRISRLFQKKPKKKQPPASLTTSFSNLSLASSELSPVSDVQPSIDSLSMRRGVSGQINQNYYPQPSQSYENQKTLPPLPQNEKGIKPESGTLDTVSTAPSLSNTTSTHHLGTEQWQSPATTGQTSSLIRALSTRSNNQHHLTPLPDKNLSGISGQDSLRSMQSIARSLSNSSYTDHTSVSALKARLEKQRFVLEKLELEKHQYEQDNIHLNDQLSQLNRKSDQRDTDMGQLKVNYDIHLCSMRATEDDLDTIAAKVRLLKESISQLAGELMEHADPVIATNALYTFWLNLSTSIDELKEGPDQTLPLHRMRMLTEKFIMDVLIQNLNVSFFPGLSTAATSAYNELCTFFRQHDREFATRLRQELALVVVKNKGQKETIDKELHDILQSNWKYLYGGLSKAYPFLYQHDKIEPDVRKHYGAKIQKLVEQAVTLGCAIKGQEIVITGADVREGTQIFDSNFMVDEDGQTSGVVAFCICPPFVVLCEPYRCLEAGKVLCKPN